MSQEAAVDLSREAAVDQIKIAFGKVLGRDMSDVNPQTKVFEDLNVDSTGILEILMELEDGVGFEVDVDTLDQSAFETIGSLADYLVAMTAKG